MPADPDALRQARLEALFSRTSTGIAPGLELTRALLDALGAPEQRFLTVHVAGTNGKGSVCAILESILRAMGLRTGRFTSPHLLRLNERFCIDGQAIPDAALFDLLDRVDAAAGHLERKPSFFEVCTAVAFQAFADAGVQVAVVETGMGGRWDSTNVVTPLLSVITPVDLDHMEFLGNSLTEIAAEKAGIIKEGRPVVLGSQQEAAANLLKEVARERNASCVSARERVSITRSGSSLQGQRVSISTHAFDAGRLSFPLCGAVQVEALTTAIAAAEEVVTQIPGLVLDRDILQRAFAQLEWPARFQVLQEDPPVILDVAHNPAGARVLCKELQEQFGKKARGVFILAAMADKDVAGMLDALLPLMREARVVTLQTPRAMKAEAIASLIRERRRPVICQPLEEAMEEAVALAREEGSFVVLAGSVYLAGEVLGAQPDRGENFLRS